MNWPTPSWAGGPAALNCVISDIRMPGLNGIELVRKLKGEGSSCPVILITGHGDVALAVEAMKAGAVDFIEKPFDDAALLGAIRSALDALPEDQTGSSAKKEAAAIAAAVRSATLAKRSDCRSPSWSGLLKSPTAGTQPESAMSWTVCPARMRVRAGRRSVS